MRITQLSSFNSLKRYLNDNRTELAKYQHQLSSGKRVTKASDDNIAFSTSRRLKDTLRQNEQYQTNISSGITKSRFAQDALDSMTDVLIELKEVGLNAASDTLNETDRELLADQVAGFKDKLIDMGNTEFNGTHLFAGTKTDTPPFFENEASVGGVGDTSNAKSLKAQISETSRVEVSITGNELRDTGEGDLFGIVDNMESALRNNDTETLNQDVDVVNEAINHVTRLTARLGSNINRMEFLNSQHEEQSITTEGEISRLTDTDYAEAISQVQKHETTYQAALSVHSRIMQTSLLDYL